MSGWVDVFAGDFRQTLPVGTKGQRVTDTDEAVMLTPFGLYEIKFLPNFIEFCVEN